MSQFKTRVDENAIVTALSGMPIVGNEEGMIPAFGVYLTRHYADYYNKISFRFEKALQKAFGDEMSDIAAPLLIEAGHVCAFNTFGGIMKSDEWYGLIHPMLDTREDWVHGMVACVNALGWGKWVVNELVPDDKLVIDIHGSYESVGYKKEYGHGDRCECYLATGAASGVMNLIYHVDISTKPVLDQAFYEKTFKDPNSFGSVEVMCEAKGDPHCRVVVSRDIASIHKH
jgi:hypothetical protein